MNNNNMNNELMVQEGLRLQMEDLLMKRMASFESMVNNMSGVVTEVVRNQTELELRTSKELNKIYAAVHSIDDKLVSTSEDVTGIKENVDNIHGFMGAVRDTFERAQNKVETIGDKANMAIEMITSSNNIDNAYSSYVNQTALGKSYKVNISSVRMGKLLKIVGLAQRSKPKTIPYADAIPKFAKQRQTSEGHIQHKWNSKECFQYINKWMEKRELFQDFYVIEHEKDMKTFIDNLYENYILKGNK